MILHVTPGLSAGGSLRLALRDAGRNEEVLPFQDDLSCGPIDPYDPATRAAWWNGQFQDMDIVAHAMTPFWQYVTITDVPMVVWFGRHSASELAFLHCWVDRLGDRPYQAIDVTGLRIPFTRRDGTPAISDPTQSVGVVPTSGLRSLFGAERPLSIDERGALSANWQRLRAENAPFRVVTEMGLTSAPLDHFDARLLSRASAEWKRVNLLIHEAMEYGTEPFLQVGDLMLFARVLDLVERGALIADTADVAMRGTRVRRPG